MLVLKCLKFDCFTLQSQKMKCLVLLRYPIQTLLSSCQLFPELLKLSRYVVQQMLRPNSVPVFMGLELYKVNFIFRAPRLSRLCAKERWAASHQGFDTVYTGVIEGLG